MAIGIGYKVGVKEEIVTALRKVFGARYPDPELANKVNITTEYPLRPDHYPAVLVRINEDTIEDVGIGNYQVVLDSNTGFYQKVKQWRFTGSLIFEIRALTPLDRDIISQGIIEMLAFGHEMPEYTIFFDEIYDADFADIQLLTQNVSPGQDAVEDVPWDNREEKVYTDTYSIPILGEFFTDPRNGNLVRISQVNAYAYQPTSPVIPQGSQAHGTKNGVPYDDRTVPWEP